MRKIEQVNRNRRHSKALVSGRRAGKIKAMRRAAKKQRIAARTIGG